MPGHMTGGQGTGAWRLVHTVRGSVTSHQWQPLLSILSLPPQAQRANSSPLGSGQGSSTVNGSAAWSFFVRE